MLYYEYTVVSKDIDHIHTELWYATAHAKTHGFDLLRILYTDVRPQGSALLREVRAMKRSGAIRFFLTPQEIGGDSAQARYFANKYPEAQAAVTGDGLDLYYMIGL